MIGGGTLRGRSIGIVLYCKSIPWSAPVDLYFVAYGCFRASAARRARPRPRNITLSGAATA